ncbi:DUF1479 domain-containing protein [Pleurostoma richardsiae]|uniref:DUF1479 domain-containing protein n=1 Tax=Pleurostoma richardsiae TaxID=41990 RepID=A0AA38VRY4_9PEZI|nr:DUF1479 domain-containing protein [Pleurostoma richardsiae]
MPSAIAEWPAWVEYPKKTPYYDKDPEFNQRREEGDPRGSITDEIAARGNSLIPVFEASQLAGGFTGKEKDEIMEKGCLVIRGVIPKEQADQLYEDLGNYVSKINSRITAPIKALLTLSSTLMVSVIVPPLQPFLGLGPHIDAGSFSRWADPAYRKAYSDIFSGNFENYDPYDLGARISAVQDLYKASAHSSVFRSFQGWTALTRTAPREGTLLVYPHIAATIAYVLLRPFFKPPSDELQLMDASKWTVDKDSSWFPGTVKTQSQRLSRSSHPHLRLEECLVHIPVMNPGDTVWGHSDLCHAVDSEHHGAVNASVVYIAACPSTPASRAYVKRQLEYTRSGRPPADFASATTLDETTLDGYVGHTGMSAEAKAAFGYYL